MSRVAQWHWGAVMNVAAPPERATRWISRGLESLQAELASRAQAAPAKAEPDFDFDVLIVGSGYGGAVAADRLSARTHADGAPLRIAVLERGREYLRGAFPSSLAEVAGHVRFTTPEAGRARGRLEGLFDMRVGKDVSVLVANGVGGGSLINAGVMLLPQPEVFAEPPWPASIDHADLQQRAQRLRHELGAARADGSDNVLRPDARVARRDAMRRIDAPRFREVPLSIALEDGRSVANVALQACIGCGDCASGCNHGAKNSLDLNLLRRAQQRGVAVFSGATVSRLSRPEAGPGWVLDVWHTDLALRRRMQGALRLRARRVVLAAGTLGSTELLLRSQSASLKFSDLLGQRFSGNGDLLAALYDGKQRMNAVADEAQRPSQRGIGPTISGMLDWRDASATAHGGCLVQDLAVPAPLRRLFEETTATVDLLHRLGERDSNSHHPDDAGIDPNAVDAAKVERSTVVAIITRDAACGVLSAIAPKPGDERDAGLEVDPGVAIRWSDARDDPRIEASHRRLRQAIERPGSIGGRLLPNPMWRLLPEGFEQLLSSARGGLVTVHPLGGCGMGTTRADGVVDHLGRVFDGGAAGADQVHDGLVVLDGSIVPTSLGVNPALTIAVLADRAIEGLCVRRADASETWVAAPPSGPPDRRPPFAFHNDRARVALPTQIEIAERLSGVVQLQGSNYFVELSLVFQPTPASMHGASLRGRELRVRADPQLSRLRIFADASPPPQPLHRVDVADEMRRMRLLDERSDASALLIAPVEGGSLRVLHREASNAPQRVWRAAGAWLCNRGLRDLWQELVDARGRRLPGPAKLVERLGQWLALASRAGEVRRFDYDLTLGAAVLGDTPQSAAFAGWPCAGRRIVGDKRLSYERGASPIAQLMRVTLREFAGLPLGKRRMLEVSPSYFARMQLPLLRVVQQQDLPNAYADLAGFALYLVRVLLNNHLWSLRKPDAQTERKPQRLPQRLPGSIPGLPAPGVHTLDGGDGVALRLTVYPRARSTRPPVLMIHGYSASGTTFAHPALPCSLAAYLWRQGAQPWIVDLRSSCGMPTAQRPWTFEDMARYDIPAAVDFVSRAHGGQPIDVVSHCMGSAMLAMALLRAGDTAAKLRAQMRSWVMSQATPAMLFSPANLLRAYLLQYALNLLPRLDYPIGGSAGPAGVDADAFDRLLAALPYLGAGRDSEFEVENPPPWRFWQRTPWVRTRHRLDALFGRVFDARRLSRRTLEHIDDFFGEISLATVSQTIHFARNAFVADCGGSADAYWDAHKLRRLAGLPTLSLHARNSGLLDWETALALQPHRAAGGWEVQSWLVENCGHQDLLIGRDATLVFHRIDRFLREVDTAPKAQQVPTTRTVLNAPDATALAAGPRIVAEAPKPLDEDEIVRWPAFFASVEPTPLLALVQPFRQIDGALQPVDAAGNPDGDWIAAAHRIAHHGNGRSAAPWTRLPRQAGWRLHADLNKLPLQRAHCDGALVLFIVEQRKTGVFDGFTAPAPEAMPARDAANLPAAELRAALARLPQALRRMAAVPWS